MATVDNPNAAVRSGNGLGAQTHIVSVTDVSAVSVADVIAEATSGDANDVAFTVAAVEDAVATDGCHIALQGTAVPSLTGATVVVTFADNALATPRV